MIGTPKEPKNGFWPDRERWGKWPKNGKPTIFDPFFGPIFPFDGIFRFLRPVGPKSIFRPCFSHFGPPKPETRSVEGNRDRNNYSWFRGEGFLWKFSTETIRRPAMEPFFFVPPPSVDAGKGCQGPLLQKTSKSPCCSFLTSVSPVRPQLTN